ncbi:hypothetical protein DIPPA_17351 [Diplonema papillatum]|nr:hypothetical protein DIPPA_17351 [Diplonema papillatum]
MVRWLDGSAYCQQNGHSEVVKELIAAGAKVDVQDNEKMIGWVAFLRTLFNEEEWRDVSRSLRGLPDDTTLLTLERLPMWALPVRVPSPELYRRVQDLVRARDQSSPALVSPVTPVEKRSTSQRRALKRALEDVPLMQPALA